MLVLELDQKKEKNIFLLIVILLISSIQSSFSLNLLGDVVALGKKKKNGKNCILMSKVILG